MPLAPVAAYAPTGGDEGWDRRLPADFKRAGPEIFRSLKAQAANSMRTWLQANYTSAKDAPIWMDLWSAASMVEFRLAQAGMSDEQVNLVLASNDNMEIALRRLASYVYGRRTGDYTRALHMLAVRPPGNSTDVVDPEHDAEKDYTTRAEARGE